MFFHNAFVKVIAFIVEVVVFFAVAVAVYVLFRLGHMYSTQCINCFSFFGGLPNGAPSYSQSLWTPTASSQLSCRVSQSAVGALEQKVTPLLCT